MALYISKPGSNPQPLGHEPSTEPPDPWINNYQTRKCHAKTRWFVLVVIKSKKNIYQTFYTTSIEHLLWHHRRQTNRDSSDECMITYRNTHTSVVTLPSSLADWRPLTDWLTDSYYHLQHPLTIASDSLHVNPMEYFVVIFFTLTRKVSIFSFVYVDITG